MRAPFFTYRRLGTAASKTRPYFFCTSDCPSTVPELPMGLWRRLCNSCTLFEMSKNEKIIVLYGNSLVISGIAASLERRRQWQLHQISAAASNLFSQLLALHPDALIFDMAAGLPAVLLALLREQPHLLLIGVDLKCCEILQWAIRRVQTLTTENLVQVIQQMSDSPDESQPSKS